MLPWFLRDEARLTAEREAINDLSREVSWLGGFEWRVEGDLFLDAIVRAHGHDYEVRVEFPPLFPDAPIVVRPREADARWSGHQYVGPNGPLCLEWSADNWVRSVTGRQMLESTHRLLEIENPLGNDRAAVPTVAPSRHHLTIGQETRGKLVRWYKGPELSGFLARQSVPAHGTLKFSLRDLDANWAVLVHAAAQVQGEAWLDPQIPASIPRAKPDDLRVGVWFKTVLDGARIGTPSDINALRELLKDHGGGQVFATDGSSPVDDMGKATVAVLIIDREGAPHALLLLASDTVIRCAVIGHTEADSNARAPEAERLRPKRVGIVGLGSAGSKLALSFARMGVGSFYLVDHDVLLPENLQRHALSWQGVTEHKVDATKTAIEQISAAANVSVSRVHLSGQESNAAINGVLARLAECDLLVDATANARVFNLLSAVARTAGKPLVWLEVYGGGAGGLVARSRPGVDPDPQDMRQNYLQYCTDNPAPEGLHKAEAYDQHDTDGRVLVASDADVAIVSHHTARLALDSLVPSGESHFPFSMYLVGVRKVWVFEAPFSTIPIQTSHLPVSDAAETHAVALGPENAAFLLDLFGKPVK